ncbi:MAG TPA: HEAT repeat domain-containing protein [Vicinamibacterales bacterium]|jgi:hypothetical protein
MVTLSVPGNNRSDLQADRIASTVTLRPADIQPVEEFLKQLARAVRQFHTYPPTSPLCLNAVTACHESLAVIGPRDRLVLRVAPSEFIVDEVRIGGGTIIEHELSRRLSRARVRALEIDRAASARDVSRFCADLVDAEDLEKSRTTLADRLAEHGVNTIVPGMALRPEVLEIGTPTAPLCDLMEHERRRRRELISPDAPVSYLYPPDKGWVRIDPSQSLDTVSLMDLVVLVADPAEVATMLLRLTDEEPAGPDARQAALERKFSDVTTLVSSLDPRLARIMFEKLARAVLDLDPERRKTLLQRTILPGLLDKRPDGSVLRDFPDLELADSLCLLLDLEAAAPEVLATALNHLDLAPERRESVAPLIDERVRARQTGNEPPGGLAHESSLDRYARELIRIEAKSGKDFSEFTAFDFAIDEHAASAVSGIREGIGATDLLSARVRFVWQLVRLEPNPTIVESFLGRVCELLVALERDGRWQEFATSIASFGQLAVELKERRPDVAETIVKAVTDFCSPARVLALIQLYERDSNGRQIATDVIKALGGALVQGFIVLLDDVVHEQRARALTPIFCEHAVKFAPAFEAALQSCGLTATRVAVRVMGHGGVGHEAAVAKLVAHEDDQVAREAFRALARIGTTAAAALVSRQIREGNIGRRAAAEEALWHFPPGQTAAQVRQFLGSRDFVVQHPQMASRLLDRAAQARTEGLEDVLARLEQLRFRFWKPHVVRVARKARELRVR